MSETSVSVVIPSALKAAPDGEAWLKKALRSVAAQTLQPVEVIVGVDPGERVPGDTAPAGCRFDFHLVNGPIPGHQAATNAAGARCRGEWLAMLEDDDEFLPEHLETLLRAAQEHDARFVSCSQQCVSCSGADLYETTDGANRPWAFHFPTASTWLIHRNLWARIGGFDVKFFVHHDNRALSMINELGAKRVHLVRKDEPPHPWLDNVARHARVVPCLDRLTVRRTVHEGSILAGCRQDSAKALRSQKEYVTLEVLHGCIGW